MENRYVSGGSVILSGPGMHEMAGYIDHEINLRSVTKQEVKVTRFADGEIKCKIPETVRGEHAFLLWGLHEPDPNTAVMSMLIAANALKYASVTGITLVVPYIPYLRQDRKDEPRAPISARMLADLIESNRKIERVITLEMHAAQEQGFFSIPVDDISPWGVQAKYLLRQQIPDVARAIVVAPDFGSAVRARKFAAKLGPHVPVSIIEKRRTGPNQAEAIGFIGPDVEDCDVVLFDDMIDTGGTIRAAVRSILERKALSVCVCATHGIFSSGAEEKFAELGVPVVVTPTIPREPAYRDQHRAWLQYIPIHQLLAMAIREAMLVGGSISKLSAA